MGGDGFVQPGRTRRNSAQLILIGTSQAYRLKKPLADRLIEPCRAATSSKPRLGNRGAMILAKDLTKLAKSPTATSRTLGTVSRKSAGMGEKSATLLCDFHGDASTYESPAITAPSKPYCLHQPNRPLFLALGTYGFPKRSSLIQASEQARKIRRNRQRAGTRRESLTAHACAAESVWNNAETAYRHISTIKETRWNPSAPFHPRDDRYAWRRY